MFSSTMKAWREWVERCFVTRPPEFTGGALSNKLSLGAKETQIKLAMPFNQIFSKFETHLPKFSYIFRQDICVCVCVPVAELAAGECTGVETAARTIQQNRNRQNPPKTKNPIGERQPAHAAQSASLSLAGYGGVTRRPHPGHSNNGAREGESAGFM